MNLLNPKKLLLTKWTAVKPVAKQKHFLVCRVIEPKQLTDPIERVEIEAVFSKKAKRYVEVKDSITGDDDYKQLILSDYTFLKRPVILYGDFYSVGNDRAAIERLILRFNLVNSK